MNPLLGSSSPLSHDQRFAIKLHRQPRLIPLECILDRLLFFPQQLFKRPDRVALFHDATSAVQQLRDDIALDPLCCEHLVDFHSSF